MHLVFNIGGSVYFAIIKVARKVVREKWVLTFLYLLFMYLCFHLSELDLILALMCGSALFAMIGIISAVSMFCCQNKRKSWVCCSLLNVVLMIISGKHTINFRPHHTSKMLTFSSQQLFSFTYFPYVFFFKNCLFLYCFENIEIFFL